MLFFSQNNLLNDFIVKFGYIWCFSRVLNCFLIQIVCLVISSVNKNMSNPISNVSANLRNSLAIQPSTNLFLLKSDRKLLKLHLHISNKLKILADSLYVRDLFIYLHLISMNWKMFQWLNLYESYS